VLYTSWAEGLFANCLCYPQTPEDRLRSPTLFSNPHFLVRSIVIRFRSVFGVSSSLIIYWPLLASLLISSLKRYLSSLSYQSIKYRVFGEKNECSKHSFSCHQDLRLRAKNSILSA
jgi:hypothetical protein